MPTIVRSAALLTAGLVAAASLQTAATAAPTPVKPGSSAASAATSSASWLAKQVKTGVIHNAQYDIDDQALTADTAYALVSLGGHKKQLAKVRKTLAAQIDAWTTGGSSTDLYAGSVAKAAVTAKLLGANPAKFGGVNLISELSSLVATTAPIKGRVQDKSSYGDYANVVGQALAVRALSVAKAKAAKPATAFLLEQQCRAGYFRLDFADATAANQTCAGGDKATTSAPDTDTTALAVISLEAVPHPSAKVTKAITKAKRWLAKQQKHNGSFGGGVSTETPNANSTGLAGAALGELGDCTAAAKAARWVTKLQVTKANAGSTLKGQIGAIAYDRAALKAGKSAGITTDTQDQWRRAASQGALVLPYATSCQ